MPLERSTLSPVSYTHLDVYKRQDLEAGEAKFTGRIDALEYTASAPAGSFLHRLLR